MPAAPGGTDIADIVVVGEPARTHGCFDAYTVAYADAVTAARFDNRADTWTATTADGRTLTARVLVDTAPGADGIVAVHAMPNRFRIPGPHTARQARYLADCLAGMLGGGSTRIEARSRVRVHRRLPTRGLSRFYLTGSVGVDDEIYDGPAEFGHDGSDYPARVRLTGHFDPIDGNYHWQGMLFGDLPTEKITGATVRLRVGGHSAEARVSERTPWGTLAVVGAAGYPPFALDDVEVALPPRL